MINTKDLGYALIVGAVAGVIYLLAIYATSSALTFQHEYWQGSNPRLQVTQPSDALQPAPIYTQADDSSSFRAQPAMSGALLENPNTRLQ